MTHLIKPNGNAMAEHSAPEDFRTFAAPELAVSTPWVRGVCFLPQCGASFTPRREWQIYCCTRCEQIGTAELRRWGHRMALPLLVWVMGKYEKHDEGRRDLSRAGRRYVAHAQSEWLQDRQSRARAREAG